MLLELDYMHLRHPGLTWEIAASNSQAARVCLDRHHLPPISVTVDDRGGARSKPPSNTPLSLKANWRRTTPAERAAWANDTDRTEQGAYAFALAAVEAARGLVAVRRAETGTGSDYYLAPRGAAPDDLESAVRLEVSGVDSGSAKLLEARLLQKLAQAQAGASNLPAAAAVVGFKEGTVLLQDA